MSVLRLIQAHLLPAIRRVGFKDVPLPQWPNAADGQWSFSNGNVCLEVFFADQTHELSLGFAHPEGPAVPLGMLLEREGDPDADWLGYGLMFYELERAKAALVRLAAALDRNAGALSRLTPHEVADLERTWAQQSEIETRRWEVERAVKQAEEQWRLGNFSRCAKILGEFEAELTRAQRKRLEIALRKAQDA